MYHNIVTPFEAGHLDPAAFHHADHVRLGYELLAGDPFDVAATRMAEGLRRLAATRPGRGRFHMTTTTAFLAIIAERRAADPALPWDGFIARHADLLDKSLLTRWYPSDVLSSAVARETFILPPAAVR